MASLKQVFLFIALFVAISVNLCWGPKVMALRDLPNDVAHMKGKLLPHGFNTCYRGCYRDSDCNDGWVCTKCSEHTSMYATGQKFTYHDCSYFQ